MKAAGVGGGGGAAPDYAKLAESFARDGYVVMKGLLNADQLAAVGASATQPFEVPVMILTSAWRAPGRRPEGSSGRVRQCWFDEMVGVGSDTACPEPHCLRVVYPRPCAAVRAECDAVTRCYARRGGHADPVHHPLQPHQPHQPHASSSSPEGNEPSAKRARTGTSNSSGGSGSSSGGGGGKGSGDNDNSDGNTRPRARARARPRAAPAPAAASSLQWLSTELGCILEVPGCCQCCEAGLYTLSLVYLT